MAESSDPIGGYLGVIFTFLFVVVVSAVHFFAEPGFPLFSKILVILGVYPALAILLMVPIDVAIMQDNRTSTLQSDSDYQFDRRILSSAYDTFFTMVLIMGSAVLMFFEYLNTDGYFTKGTRLKSSLWRVFKDRAPSLVIGAIILGILLGQKVVSDDINALKLTAVIITNTAYELVLMFLLGYGLVEYPRSLWNLADAEKHLAYAQMRAATQFKDIADAQLNVSLVVSDVLKTKSHMVHYTDQELLDALDRVVNECPPEFRSERMGKVAADKDGKVTLRTLAELRTRLRVLKEVYRSAQTKVEGTKLLAYRMEDIVAAKRNPDANVIHWSLTDKDGTPFEYNVEVVYKPLFLRITAVLLFVLSILSFLGVVCSMKGVSNDVSPYFLAVHGESATVGGITIFVLLTLGYTAYIAFWSLFQIKFGASNELILGHTSPHAMSYNARLLCSLASPLAFFYLGWISENGIRTGDWNYNDAPVPIYMPTGFSYFYQLSNIDAVQEVFGTIFPIILYCVLGLVTLNIFNRLLVLLKMDEYQFGAAIVTEEQLREGKRQLQRHKKATERKYRRGELKSYILAVGNVGGQSVGQTLWQMITSFGRSENSANVGLNDSQAGEDNSPVVREPTPLEGIVERKSGGFGSLYKECFARVRSPGFLHFHRDRRSSEANKSVDPSQSSESDAVIVDLRQVIDMTVTAEKKSAELELYVSSGPMKLRFKTAVDADRWKRCLQEWKDFCMDYAVTYPYGVSAGCMVDPEANSNTVNSTSGRTVPTSVDVSDVMIHHAEESPLHNHNSYAPAGFSTGDSQLGDHAPDVMEGWLEKRGGKGLRTEWQKRFVRLTAAGLAYYKTSDISTSPQNTLDLRACGDIVHADRNGGLDYSRFNIDAGEKVYKFRAASDVEGRQWVDRLNAWKDYSLMNMA